MSGGAEAPALIDLVAPFAIAAGVTLAGVIVTRVAVRSASTTVDGLLRAWAAQTARDVNANCEAEEPFTANHFLGYEGMGNGRLDHIVAWACEVTSLAAGVIGLVASSLLLIYDTDRSLPIFLEAAVGCGVGILIVLSAVGDGADSSPRESAYSWKVCFSRRQCLMMSLNLFVVLLVFVTARSH